LGPSQNTKTRRLEVRVLVACQVASFIFIGRSAKVEAMAMARSVSPENGPLYTTTGCDSPCRLMQVNFQRQTPHWEFHASSLDTKLLRLCHNMSSHYTNIDLAEAQTSGLNQVANRGENFNTQIHRKENHGDAHQSNHFNPSVSFRQHKAVAIVGIVALVVSLFFGVIFGVVYGLKSEAQKNDRAGDQAVSTACTR